MNTVLGRCAAAVLSIGVATPGGAAERFAYSFDTCVAQRECRVVSQRELDRLRGGFSFSTAGGSIEFTFGIAQAVFVNDQLVAVTQIVSQLGDTIARLAPNGVPAETLVAALQSASGAVGSSTGAAAQGTQSAAGAAKQGAQAAQPAIQAAAGAATQATQTVQPAIQAATGAATQAAQAVSPAVQAASGAATQGGAQAVPPAVQPASSAVTNATQSIQPSTQSASSAVSNATQAANPAIQSSTAAASGAAGTAAPGGQPATQVTTSQAATASQAAVANTPPSAPASGPSANAASSSSQPSVLVNGVPVVPGQPVVNVPTAAELRSLLVQVGPGNNAQTIGNGAVAIQNTVNGAAIRAMTVLEVSAKLKDALSVDDGDYLELTVEIAKSKII